MLFMIGLIHTEIFTVNMEFSLGTQRREKLILNKVRFGCADKICAVF